MFHEPLVLVNRTNRNVCKNRINVVECFINVKAVVTVKIKLQSNFIKAFAIRRLIIILIMFTVNRRTQLQLSSSSCKI